MEFYQRSWAELLGKEVLKRLRRKQRTGIRVGQFWRQVLRYAEKHTSYDLASLDLSVPLA